MSTPRFPIGAERLAKFRALLDDEFRSGTELTDIVEELLDAVDSLPTPAPQPPPLATTALLVGGTPRGGKARVRLVMEGDADCFVWPTAKEAGDDARG